MKNTKGNYPNTFYRVSLKAIIRNKAGEVLVAREGVDIWNLVGGGIGHGETDIEALRRELYEEALITAPFEAKVIGVDSRFLESRQAYLMWVVYELTFEDEPSFGVGVDTSEVAYMNPRQFHSSPHLTERQVYKWTVDRSYDALREPNIAK